MRDRPAGSDQIIAYPSRERQVGDPVAMEMTELAPTPPELDTTETTRRDIDPWPGPDRGDDPLRRAGGRRVSSVQRHRA
jgi:hypothetical protein